jgi:hypothetical protein
MFSSFSVQLLSAVLEFIAGLGSFALSHRDFKEAQLDSSSSSKLLSRARFERFFAICWFTAAGLTIFSLYLDFGSRKADEVKYATVTNELATATNDLNAAKAKALMLDARLQPRRIKVEQAKTFKWLTENIDKIPIKIVVTTGGQEESTFASDLREMFIQAGFKNNSPGNAAVVFDESKKITRPFGMTNEPPDLLFINGSTNDMWLASMGKYTNGFLRPATPNPQLSGTNSDQVETYFALDSCLRQIGIQCDWFFDADWLHSDECMIVVMPK